jgi:exosortase/archaeosortase family protein
MSVIFDKKFLWFVASFLVLFALLYYGTIAMIGIAAPGGYYSPFVEHHLDYVSWIKKSLMAGVGWVLGMVGYDTVKQPDFVVRIAGKKGVLIAMDCVGYGVYSFWMAYVIANRGKWFNKMFWVLAGVLALWMINVVRISLFLVAVNKNQSMPLGIDHHTWFTLWAYGFIFLMIWWHNKKQYPAKPNAN